MFFVEKKTIIHVFIEKKTVFYCFYFVFFLFRNETNKYIVIQLYESELNMFNCL